jgi:hypothetical protein
MRDGSRGKKIIIHKMKNKTAQTKACVIRFCTEKLLEPFLLFFGVWPITDDVKMRKR